MDLRVLEREAILSNRVEIENKRSQARMSQQIDVHRNEVRIRNLTA